MMHVLRDETTAHYHATVAQARACQEEVDAETAMMDMDDVPCCPICDAMGCNGAKGFGCDLYERDERVAREDAEEAFRLAFA